MRYPVALLLSTAAACSSNPAPEPGPVATTTVTPVDSAVSAAQPPTSNAAVPPPAPAPQVCTAEALAGDWSGKEGTAFEDITLLADGTYRSFLHARPFETGSWKLEADTLVLRAQTDTVTRIHSLACGGEEITGQDAESPVRLAPIAPKS